MKDISDQINAIEIDVSCHCEKCQPKYDFCLMHMIVCPKCGNKRCPHASYHKHDCTNSNEPGQKGSSY